jgi:glutamate dehydrogenase (NAD(P)+)
MAPDAGVEECLRLARAMTLKNAAAGLPHGGGKSVIVADPHAPEPERERLVRAFAAAIRTLVDYVPGPDMGTSERSMAWIHDEIGRAVGLPAGLGGVALDEIGATGLGVAVACEVAAGSVGLDLEGARVAVQGFGAVGRHAAGFLAARGCRLVAAADLGGTVHDPAGLDVAALAARKGAGHSVATLPGAETLERDAIVEVDCDILVPAARPDVIHAGNAGDVRARLIVPGANLPATAEAEAALHARGILLVPDLIANAGGVIAAAVEWRGGTEGVAMRTIEERIRSNTGRVLEEARRRGSAPRDAALRLAEDRVRRAMEDRRFT